MLFDGDGVVVFHWRFREHLEREHDITPDITQAFFSGVFQDCLLGRANLREVLPRFLSQWGWKGSVGEFVAVWLELEDAVEGRMVEVILGLRRSGYLCGLASSQERLRAEYMTQAMGFADIFDHLFFSCDLGYQKPDPAYLREIERLLRFGGASTLFWDDSPKNVEAARDVGCQAELYTDYEDLKPRMRTYWQRRETVNEPDEPVGSLSVSVIVPALNEEAVVGEVVARIAELGLAEVIVVDNGSSDRTGEVAAEAGALVVQEPQRGYGAACMAGVKASGGEILVFMDADGSYDSAQIHRLTGPLCEDKADLVLGSRTVGDIVPGAMPVHQRFGNWLAAQLLRWLYGLKVTDLGPFRALRRGHLEALNLSEMTFGWPTEMMVKAARMGYRVIEVPVTYRPRLAGRSKVSGTIVGSVKAGYYIIRTVLKHARGI